LTTAEFVGQPALAFAELGGGFIEFVDQSIANGGNRHIAPSSEKKSSGVRDSPGFLSRNQRS
jgi:hypothetical protein